jgi:hypothetical protein
MRILVAIISVGLYSFGCLSLGMIMLYAFRVNRAGGIVVSTSGYLGSAFAMGQGILGVTWQSVTVIGYFTTWVVAGLLSALLLIVCGSIGRLRIIVGSLWGAVSDIRREGIEWCVILIFIAMLIGAIICLTSYPPMEDAEAFYLSLPRLFASTHAFSMLPGYEAFSQIGLGSEMHAAVYYSLVAPLYDEFAAELAAKLNVIPAIGAMCFVLLALTSRVGGGRQAQVLGVAMILSSSMIWMIVLLSKSDLYPALLGVAAMYWVMVADDRHEHIAIATAGLLTGLAVSGKISYLAVMGPMLAVIIAWHVWSRDGIRSTIRILLLARNYATLGLWALVGVAPLVIKNTVVFGQPLAPLILIGAEPSSWLHQTWFSPETTRWIVSTYPLALIYGKYDMQAGTLSPLWLAFAPMILLSSWGKYGSRSESALLAVAAALALSVWIILEPSVIAPRYYMPAVVVLIPIAAIAAERAIKGKERKALWIAVIISVMVVLSLDVRHIARSFLRRGYSYFLTTPANWGREDAVWAALNALNQVAAQGERVYFATYWSLQARPDLLLCAWKGSETLTELPPDLGKFIAALTNDGVRYIIQDTETHKNSVPSWNELKQIPGISRKSFGLQERMVIYTLNTGDGVSDSSRCVKNQEGIWRLGKTN